MTSPGQTLGQALRAAREARRWDLARAERETRIRSRYLVALERGDYRDLPSAVYTRGFVRNYATALGLSPEQCLEQYRREAPPDVEARPRLARPSPISLPRGSSLLTRSRVVTVAVIVGVVTLVAYIGYQFVTFAGTPELTVTDPPSDIAAYEGTSYVLRGETEPNAELTIDGLRENPTATASPTGIFNVRVELVPGSNVITVTATDPLTGRTSDPVRRTITVTLPVESPLPSGASPLPGAAAPPAP